MAQSSFLQLVDNLGELLVDRQRADDDLQLAHQLRLPVKATSQVDRALVGQMSLLNIKVHLHAALIDQTLFL